ncbi:amino acid ABC transporter permease [Pelagibius sp. Alg239-R121]|uniref:amino acid ABC transporter permease n=1 Tax=Pelagibius sp. Alg239-R121 TaxID=2993448 RepID=UPI002AC33849|nr:amino acid ABC transporter permease [Pelagibius sp. Alg239-R121]
MSDMTQGNAPGQHYPPGQHPDMPPPPGTVGFVGWLRNNLFSSIPNSILTILAIYLLYAAIPPILGWAFFNADFEGASRTDCTAAGACWALIDVRGKQFLYGFYPDEELWRVYVAGFILLLAILPVLFDKIPFRKLLFANTILLPVTGFFLLSGTSGSPEAILPTVETPQWGGLLLTMVIGVTGIVASLPIGIALALGRRSNMPVVRTMCVTFIEFVRGVPLITILFMSSVMVPLFLPEGVNFDKLLRCLIGVSLFSAAYMAEVIRGGLQAIPKGQYEAAAAMGLSFWKMMYFIILPQALRIVIPGIVNTFIGLFKDTSLVLIIGLFDLLGIAKTVVTDANWIGLIHESYAFVAVIYWIFCFGMSRYSIWLEAKLHTGHKR